MDTFYLYHDEWFLFASFPISPKWMEVCGILTKASNTKQIGPQWVLQFFQVSIEYSYPRNFTIYFRNFYLIGDYPTSAAFLRSHILKEFDIHLFSLSEMYKNRFRKIAAPSKLYTIACNFSDKYHITTEIFQNENRKQNFWQKSSLKVHTVWCLLCCGCVISRWWLFVLPK